MGLELERRPHLPLALRRLCLFVVEDPAINNPGTKKPPRFGRGLSSSVDLNF